MKTTKSITLALAATCALGASALADQQPNQKPRMPQKQTQKAKTWENQPMALRVVESPVIFLERSGHSILRSPQIVSETFRGERQLVSKHGFLTKREMRKSKAASARSETVANRRG